MKRRKNVKVIVLSILVIIMCIITYLLIPYSPVKDEYWKAIDGLTQNSQLRKDKITEKDLEKLPIIVQKYFINNGYVGVESAAAVVFDFKDVDFSMGVNKPKLKIDYVAYDFVKDPARLALIDTRMFGVPFQGIDVYEDGKGAMKGVVAKNITLFNEKGKDMDSGGLVTYLSECLMHPSLAIQDKITYKTIGKYAVEATIEDKGIRVSGIFYFNEKYEMTSFQSKRFASDTNSYVNWSAVASKYRKINGINVPTKLQAVWHYDSGDLIYFDSNEMKIYYK